MGSPNAILDTHVHHHHHHYLHAPGGLLAPKPPRPAPGDAPIPFPFSLTTTDLHLALLLSTTLTLLYHADLALLLLYWLLRPLRLTPARYPRWLLPAALRPLPGGAVSSYWATLHALRWEVRRNREALGWGGVSFACFAVLAGFLPAEAGEAVMGWAGPGLWAVGEVYLHLVVACLGISWGLGGVWVVWQVVVFTEWAGVRAVGDLVVAWARFLRENWTVVFVAFAGWVSWTLAVEVDYTVVYRKTVEWGFLQCAGLLYGVGDVVRDVARSMTRVFD
ncbi:hypothetical protein C8A01DRAFT_31810 [Parachaetomium inaequale]|uniref:Uncharacterized protein n=1 Tax=Parachaetomium inaequale TaxID=2588326 RepID=A0AAN6PNV3_9PEZI|nr:hypothetical protein C8A01DRAFT_31810 [Parachaetomium inaequale]